MAPSGLRIPAWSVAFWFGKLLALQSMNGLFRRLVARKAHLQYGSRTSVTGNIAEDKASYRVQLRGYKIGELAG